ncbi:MAG: WecB/TagA/CpsF family glycosyltransferase [Proteobacteria bacterium]|nr:WecB/TagA/CpsF family glycosyltransferase [Pseudomonadota bacterium]
MRTRCQIAGFEVRRTTAAIALRFLIRQWRHRRRTIVFFANANFVTQCGHLRQTIAESSDVILLNDGLALDIAALLRSGSRFPENLNGTDFTPAFLSRLHRGARVFLLGGRPGVAQAAAEAIHGFSQVDIAGHAEGYSMWHDEAAVNRQINEAKPDILLVALGNPLQEEWILRNRNSLQVPLILAVGSWFDFVSGYTPRAPQIWRRLRLEWAYRLMREPRRLTGRYTVGMLKFFSMAIFSGDET